MPKKEVFYLANFVTRVTQKSVDNSIFHCHPPKENKPIRSNSTSLRC